MTYQEFTDRQLGMLVPDGAPRAIGAINALVLGELLDKYRLFRKYNKLNGQGRFFYTISLFEKNTGIKRSVQTKSIEILAQHNLISTALHGLPKRRYFWFTEENLDNILKLKEHKIPDSDFYEEALYE